MEISVITEITNNTAWMAMWGIALVVYGGLKWVSGWGMEGVAGAGYFLGWPGMDPTPFAGSRATLEGAGGWRRGAELALFGAVLSVMASRIAPEHPEIPMAIGIPMFLHFGVFDVLAWMWRRRGVPVRPIMDRPLGARTLSEFWSKWNTAVRDVGYRYIFRPTRRGLGLGAAVMATFGASGLVHDLVISVPAGGGYGRPTLYFLFQGAGMLIERRWRPGRVAGWLFMVVVLVAPLPLLVHPAFRMNVLRPFAYAAGRLWPW
jgi:hypothetical protein